MNIFLSYFSLMLLFGLLLTVRFW